MDVERWDAMLISRRIPSGCNRSFQRLIIFRQILLCWSYSYRSRVWLCVAHVCIFVAFFGEVFEAMKKLTFTSELFCPQKTFFWVSQFDETRMSGNGKKRKMREIQGFLFHGYLDMANRWKQSILEEPRSATQMVSKEGEIIDFARSSKFCEKEKHPEITETEDH